jgi:hypothetical protein
MMMNQLYELMHIYPTFISIFKRLSQLDLDIHEVDHQKRLVVDEDVISQ